MILVFFGGILGELRCDLLKSFHVVVFRSNIRNYRW